MVPKLRLGSDGSLPDSCHSPAHSGALGLFAAHSLHRLRPNRHYVGPLWQRLCACHSQAGHSQIVYMHSAYMCAITCVEVNDSISEMGISGISCW